MSAPTILRVVALIGTARPRPMPATAVLIPTTRPPPSASAPPELPGLSAASSSATSPEEMNVRSATAFHASSGGKVYRVPEVETQSDGGVLTITFNRPDVLNAFDEAMHELFGAA